VHASRASRSIAWLTLIAAPVAVFGVLYAWPVLHLFRLSLDRFDPDKGPVAALQVGTYGQLLADPYYLGILWRTVRLSVLTTLACAVLGYPVSVYVVASRGWRQTLLLIILLLPLVTSVTVVAYGWLILLGQQGLVNTLLLALGLTDAPVRLMFTETAIVIGLVHVLIVFMVLSVAASLQSIDPSLMRAARSLGAGYWTAFRHVVFPLSLPGLRTGALLVFSLSMSAYGIPALVGGPRVKLVSFLVYQQAISLLDWPRAASMAVILLLVTTGVLMLAGIYGRFRSRRRSMAAGEKPA
jgi:putative spermidine/putrescine transport system permease protein